MFPVPFKIVRRSDHTVVDSARDYVQGIKRSMDLAREFRRSYAVVYGGSLSPVVTVTARGELHWH